MSLVLPMSIGLAHAFHQHENERCLAQNESHFHAETTDCDQLHYFSQTIDAGGSIFNETSLSEFNLQDQVYFELRIIDSFPKADLDRGPPVINVF